MWRKQIQQSQLGFICGSERLTQLITNNFSIANIIIFETTGSILLSYMVVAYGGFVNYFDFLLFTMLVCGGTYFVAFLWSGRFCGAVLNPSVAIAYMIKKQKKVSLLKGGLYLICEFVGTIIGTVIGFYVVPNYKSISMPSLGLAQSSINPGVFFFQSFITTFIFIIVVLTLISSDVTFIEIELQVWFTIPVIYTITSILSNNTLGPNFFMGLIVPFFGSYFLDDWTLITKAWPIIVGPFAGSLVGTFFFEYFYRRFVYVYKQELRQQEEMLQRQEQEQLKRKRRQSVLQLV